MDNLMSLMFGIACNNHDADLVGRDQVDDYTIDTCLTADPRKNPAVVLQSNTKEDILERKVGYPKSSYSFWKKINGKKYYISLDNPTEVTHKVNIDAEVDWVTGYLRGGYYHGELELSEEDYKTFKKDPLNFLENHIDLWVDWPFEINDCEIDDIGELSQVYFTDQTN